MKATERLREEIAERKLAEDATREERQFFEKTFENLEEVVIVADPATRKIIACNPAVEKIYGYRQDEVIGRSTQFLHTDRSSYEEFRKEVMTTLNKRRIFRREYKMRRKDGSTFYTENTISDILDDSGNLIGMVNIQRDISESIAARKELQMAHEELEHRIQKRTSELTRSNAKLKQEIEERKHTEALLYDKENKLKQQARHLKEVNTALKVLLEHQDQEKVDIHENIMVNVKKLILPYIDEMKKGRLDSEKATYLSIIQSNLENLVSPFVKTLSSVLHRLTPREIQITDLIKHGKTSKEIAVLLGVSIHAVSVHRYSIRKKLGLLNEKINLRSYLETLG